MKKIAKNDQILRKIGLLRQINWTKNFENVH